MHVRQLAALAIAFALMGCPTEGPGTPEPTPEPTPPPPGWAEDIQPLLARYCADCHTGAATAGGEVGWLNSLEDVVAEAIAPECEGEIRAACVPMRIENGDMPFPGGCLPGGLGCITEDELQLVYEWLDAGTPE